MTEAPPTSSTRAVVCERYGSPAELVLRDVGIAEPGPGEVRVAVHAVGVNFPDALLIRGTYQERPPLPFVPGGEFAGTVVRSGPGVTGWEPGARVMAVTFLGALAAQVNVPATLLCRVPGPMPMTVAAGFLGVYCTAYYALHDVAALRSGETLLVTGASGGVGLAAVQIGRALGARVIAAASSRDKTGFAVANGAQAGIDYTQESLRDRLRDLTGGRGVDVVVDPVGGRVFDEAVRRVGRGGRYVIVGFAGGRIGALPANLPLLKGFAVLGANFALLRDADPERARSIAAAVADLYSDGRIRPHVERSYPLEAVAEALAHVEQGRARGKIVVTLGPGPAS
jgi:NADPH2:quinone reductase